MAFAYFIAGFGNALQTAQDTTFIMGLYNNDNGPLMFGAGCYGAGALIGPLVSTQFSQIPKWNFHYLASLGVSVLNLVSLLSIIRLKSQKGTLFPSYFSPIWKGLTMWIFRSSEKHWDGHRNPSGRRHQ